MAGRSVAERFWEKVDKSGGQDACWLWTSTLDRGGYGKVWLDGGQQIAHRVAWELERGTIPEGTGHLGTCVCHRCDNPRCVNPAHLFLGTHAENNRDKCSKGRQVKGSAHGRSKLTEADIPVIRERLSSGVSRRAIARVYGLHSTVIDDIACGRSWSHVPALTNCKQGEGAGG